MSKSRGCVFGLLLGSVTKILLTVLNAIIHTLASILVFFGLWIPLFYALFGLGLNILYKFNPLDWTTEGQLYLGGLVATIVCSVIITVRNLVIKPIRSIYNGFNKPVWEPDEEEEDEDKKSYKNKKNKLNQHNELPEKSQRSRREIDEKRYNSKKSSFRDTKPRRSDTSYDDFARVQRPQIYYSTIEPDALIHEYPDRFEVYKERNGREILDKVVYKQYD